MGSSDERTVRLEDVRPGVTADPGRLVVALDFDGTLAPIVDDPTRAHMHPDVAETLVALGGRVAGVAVVTGRPVRQALALGGLEEVGARITAQSGRFSVLGQYGNERWNAGAARIISPRPPSGLASFLSEVPALLREAEAEDVFMESKGIAVAFHTRRCTEADAVFERLLEPVSAAAKRHGLAVEPGRLVLEVRAPGMDKGIAVRRLVEEWQARAMLFAGDDLGDVEAFSALRDLRTRPDAESDDVFDALLVAAHVGQGPRELLDLADVAVDGPEGVVALLRELSDHLS